MQQLVETLADNGSGGETENPGIKRMMVSLLGSAQSVLLTPQDDCQKEVQFDRTKHFPADE